MAPTYEEVIAQLQVLKPEYEDRHLAHTRLRKFWHGKYWEVADLESDGIASLFRDLTSRQSDIGPDIKLVYNVLKDVCVKFQTYLSPLPQIRYYVDPPSTDTRRNQATLKERYTYGCWQANSMNKVLSDQGWFLPLMGDAWLGIYPDFKTNIPKTLLRSPEHAFPLMNYDKSCEDGVIFSWKAKASQIKRSFPGWQPRNQPQGFSFGRRKPKASDPEYEIIEWSDKASFCRWVDGVQVAGVDHNFGFDLFEHVKFINVPGEAWGHGAVEQAVNLVEMGNAYLSLMMQSAIENVFPVMVIEDPLKAPETLERGAGAVIPVNQGGGVTYLTPPSGTLLAQGEWAQNLERMIKQDTSMPDVNFGQSQGSIVTGKAINELQGAGTGTLVEMVQGVSIGHALSSWNEKAVEIARRYHKDDTIRLYGNEAAGLADINPRSFSLNIKGSQLVGSTRNEVVFMPYLDMQQKVVIGLQLAGAGLVSKKWQRENVGIPDTEAMDEEIVGEAIQDAVLALIVQSITDPEAATEADQSAVDFIEGTAHTPHPLTQLPPAPPGAPTGGPPAPGGPPPGPGGPAPGGGLPIAPIPGGPGQVEAPPIKEPPGAPVPTGGLQTGNQPGGGAVQLTDAIQAFQSMQGIQGRVFLVGQIVQTGQTTDTINVDITSSADRDTVAQQTQLPIQIKVVPGEPSEPYVEVTPGANPVLKGELPQPEEALG